MVKYGMVVDLQKCTGCASCALACKSENNVQDGNFWCHYVMETSGTFPDIRYTHMPTFCNHCDNAPCIDVCPVSPKAIFKTDEGLTLNDAERCIGCQLCKNACPYGVISFISQEPHPKYRDEAGRAVTDAVGGTVIPYYNPNRAMTWNGLGVRRRNVVEKCSFCDHRLTVGKQPYCAESCPSGAIAFGDLEDPSSEVSQLLQKYPAMRLKEELGTKPRVAYIREFRKTR